jgi:hypothetical protein
MMYLGRRASGGYIGGCIADLDEIIMSDAVKSVSPFDERSSSSTARSSEFIGIMSKRNSFTTIMTVFMGDNTRR